MSQKTSYVLVSYYSGEGFGRSIGEYHGVMDIREIEKIIADSQDLKDIVILNIVKLTEAEYLASTKENADHESKRVGDES